MFNPKPDFTEHRGSHHEEFVQWLFAAERNPVNSAAQIGHGSAVSDFPTAVANALPTGTT
jgi:hypothetical protein